MFIFVLLWSAFGFGIRFESDYTPAAAGDLEICTTGCKEEGSCCSEYALTSNSTIAGDLKICWPEGSVLNAAIVLEAGTLTEKAKATTTNTVYNIKVCPALPTMAIFLATSGITGIFTILHTIY
jgi:hypothetical protein